MASASGAQFLLDLERFAKKAKGNADLVVRKVFLDFSTRVVMRSPVGDPSGWKSPAPAGYTGGHFRGNWQYGEGMIPRGWLQTVDKTGQASLARMQAIKPQASGKVHYIVNNLPYAMELERGHSRQAPAGMVGVTVKEFQMIVRKAAQGMGG